MAQSGVQAVAGIPRQWGIEVFTASGTGNINPGDWLFYSGQFVLAGYSGLASTAYYKASGAGLAMESNPVYDPAGRAILNSALKVMAQGIHVATASFSGQPTLGLGAYPDASGSGAFTPTGNSGIGATWNTAVPVDHSALSGTATPRAAAVATVIGSQNFSNAGTGELILRVMPLPPDIRG